MHSTNTVKFMNILIYEKHFSLYHSELMKIPFIFHKYKNTQYQLKYSILEILGSKKNNHPPNLLFKKKNNFERET